MSATRLRPVTCIHGHASGCAHGCDSGDAMAGLAMLGTMIILGIYVRISDDDKDEHGHLTREGVERQEADCRELAEKISAALGTNVGIRLYDDNNITAADERVTRPDFEQ